MIGQPERMTQNRIVQLFREQLHYDYLGNWEDRHHNQNIEESILRKFLAAQGHIDMIINRAVTTFRTAASNYDQDLYTNNKNTYRLLRYGAKVKADAGDNYETVHFIDWKNPEANHFAIAEQVTVMGNREKRPDIVLYINGIAIGVIELKRSTVSIGDGSVYPPVGRVRIAAPLRMDLETIRMYAISKLSWIKKQQAKLRGQKREAPREYLSRESHYFLGKRYLLKVVETEDKPSVSIKHQTLLLPVRPAMDTKQKEMVLHEWYRDQLKTLVPKYIAKWEGKIGVQVAEFGIKHQKNEDQMGDLQPFSRPYLDKPYVDWRY